MIYKRTELAEGIGFSTVIDEKFKSSLLTVRFITPLDINTASENAVAVSLLSDTSADHPTISDLFDALIELYTSSLSSSVSKRGDLQILSLSSSWLASKYALYGEDIQGDMLDIFSGCLFRPNADSDGFNSEAFEIGKKELLDRIDSELNSKRSYAFARANETIYKGEPTSVQAFGSRKTAEAVTASSAYAAYKRIIGTAQAEISFVSAEDDPRVEEMLRKGFSAVQRRPQFCKFRSPSPLKDTPVTVSEEFDVNQCKMIMAFKTDSDDEYALRMFDTILGGTPVSLLFRNVREKLSLCYYCSSHMNTVKNTLTIDSGVERANIGKTTDAILEQLNNIKEGKFTQEDMDNAMLAIENSFRQVGDSIYSWSAWYFSRFCEGNSLAPEEVLEKYRSVTKERIIAAAGSLRPDSTYLMMDKEDEE